jgi:hypothetical protein
VGGHRYYRQIRFAYAANIAEALPEPSAGPFEVAVIKPAPDEQGHGRVTGDQIETRAIRMGIVGTRRNASKGWRSIISMHSLSY